MQKFDYLYVLVVSSLLILCGLIFHDYFFSDLILFFIPMQMVSFQLHESCNFTFAWFGWCCFLSFEVFFVKFFFKKQFIHNQFERILSIERLFGLLPREHHALRVSSPCVDNESTTILLDVVLDPLHVDF